MVVAQTHTMGALASEALGHDGSTARVMAAGSRAVYVEDGAGRILWLSPPGSVLHRRCALVPLDPGSLREGDVLYSDGSVLQSDRGHAIRWAGAAIWKAPPLGTHRIPAESAAAVLERGLSPLGPPRGLAKLAFTVMSGDGKPGGAARRFEHGLAQEASRHLAQIHGALDARDNPGLLAASSALVGLGEGLTPSGDDFLGGVLFGLRLTERGQRGAAWVEWTAVEQWLTGVAARTNKISHAILCDLAAGHGPEPLHALAEKTLTGGTTEAIAWHAGRVTRIGHTSGWDMLAGFSAALCGGSRREEWGDAVARQTRRGLAAPATLDRKGIPAGGIHGN